MQNRVVFGGKGWRRTIFFVLALLILGAQSACSIALHIRLSHLEKATPPASIQTGADSTADGRTKYTLKEYNGRIGVFSGESETPSEILGVYVFTLPEADRNSLMIGITAYGEENLRQLIEDFTA